MTNSQSLSERELEVLRLVAQGATNQQIAHELSISSNTVKVHLRNIFGKLGVMSRTEATVEAVRRGLISLPGSQPSSEPAPETPAQQERAVENDVPVVVDEAPAEAAVEPGYGQEWAEATANGAQHVDEAPAAPRSEAAVTPSSRTALSDRRLLMAAALLLVLAIGVSAALLMGNQDQTDPTENQTLQVGWELHAPLPQPRADLALAFAGGMIYAIGGEGSSGVSGGVWRFDIEAASWKQLQDKPLAVSGASAAVLGRDIYVPGGRTSTGEPSDVLEVYDPQSDRWLQRTALPEPRSDYGLVALEGKLYLFGGRGENGPTDTVFIYEASDDAWSEGPRLPSAVIAPAAVALESEGVALLIGGEGADGPVDTTWSFSPGADDPWQQKSPLPQPRARAVAAHAAGIVYLVGTTRSGDPVLQYNPRADMWQSIDLRHSSPLARMAAVATYDGIYIIGGWDGTQLLAENRVFKPVFRSYLPVAPSGPSR